MATAVSLADTLTLDSGGNSAAVWIFQIGGTFPTAADSADDVFWIVNGAATIGGGHPPRWLAPSWPPEPSLSVQAPQLALCSLPVGSSLYAQGRLSMVLS
jgi:hypothetical protein